VLLQNLALPGVAIAAAGIVVVVIIKETITGATGIDF
jgi:hypothetical protein